MEVYPMNKKVSILLLSSLLGSSMLNADGAEVISTPQQAPAPKALTWGQKASAAAFNQVEAHPYITGALETAGVTVAGAGLGYGLYKQHQFLKDSPYWMAGVYTAEAAASIVALGFAYKKGLLTREQLVKGVQYIWATKGADFCKAGARTIGNVSCWIGRKALNFFTHPVVEGAIAGAVAKEAAAELAVELKTLAEKAPETGKLTAAYNAVAQKVHNVFSSDETPVAGCQKGNANKSGVKATPTTVTRVELETELAGLKEAIARTIKAHGRKITTGPVGRAIAQKEARITEIQNQLA